MDSTNDLCLIRSGEARYRQGEKAALAQVYLACRRIALAIITRQSREKGFALSPEKALEKAHDAAAYIAEQYLSRGDFSLRKPKAYIWLRCMRELYGGKKRERKPLPLELIDLIKEREEGK